MRILLPETAGLIVDVQERLVPHMHERDALESRLLILIRGLEILGVPLLVTQQYTRGLGDTIPSVREALGWKSSETASSLPFIEKRAFSCCDDPGFSTALASLGRLRVIVAGIEAHVCVLQTALDLQAGGYTAVVAADCVSSRRASDRDVAFRRMQAEGVLLTTCESILFELARTSAGESFKAISGLVK
jgi:nicotinamidase-related amidase